MSATTPKKFGILNCEDDPAWSHLEQMWVNALRIAPEDQWEMFKVWEKEWPSDEKLAEYSGLAITGSHHTAYGLMHHITFNYIQNVTLDNACRYEPGLERAVLRFLEKMPREGLSQNLWLMLWLPSTLNRYIITLATALPIITITITLITTITS